PCADWAMQKRCSTSFELRTVEGDVVFSAFDSNYDRLPVEVRTIRGVGLCDTVSSCC
ncbi:MAG: hypothetical protein ACI8P0_004853, partial [Planctomycetaceae bacterium]